MPQDLHSRSTTERILNRLALSLFVCHPLYRVGNITGHPSGQGEKSGDLLQDSDVGGIELSLLVMCGDPNRPDRASVRIAKRHDQPFHDGCRRFVEILKQSRWAGDEDRGLPVEAKPARAEVARRRAADVGRELTR